MECLLCMWKYVSRKLTLSWGDNLDGIITYGSHYHPCAFKASVSTLDMCQAEITSYANLELEYFDTGHLSEEKYEKLWKR